MIHQPRRQINPSGVLLKTTSNEETITKKIGNGLNFEEFKLTMTCCDTIDLFDVKRKLETFPY